MYTDVLKKTMGLDSIKDLCVRIDLKDMVYPLCFIYSETLKYLVVDSTGDDGCERKVIIPKSEVISITIVYQQDIDGIFEENEEERMFR